MDKNETELGTATSASDERVDSTDLLAKAHSFEDSEHSIYKAESYLLRKIAETSENLIEAEGWPEFAEAVGGVEKMKREHAEAVAAWKEWYSEAEDYYY